MPLAHPARRRFFRLAYMSTAQRSAVLLRAPCRPSNCVVTSCTCSHGQATLRPQGPTAVLMSWRPQTALHQGPPLAAPEAATPSQLLPRSSPSSSAHFALHHDLLPAAGLLGACDGVKVAHHIGEQYLWKEPRGLVWVVHDAGHHLEPRAHLHTSREPLSYQTPRISLPARRSTAITLSSGCICAAQASLWAQLGGA